MPGAARGQQLKADQAGMVWVGGNNTIRLPSDTRRYRPPDESEIQIAIPLPGCLKQAATNQSSIRPNKPTIHDLGEGQRSRPGPALITPQSPLYNHVVVMHSPSASYPFYPAEAS
jgi:hypothetical protein